MSKRTKLALLIILALLLLALGVWFFVQPLLKARNTAQPPSLPENVVPYAPSNPTGQSQQTPTSAPTVPAPTAEQNKQLVLEQKARSTVERIGSGSSGSGFLGYQDVLADATANGQTALIAEQKAMQQQHPATGPVYGISTRGVASHLTDGVIGDAQIQITVDAIQNIDSGDPTAPVQRKGKRVTVTLMKQADGSYLIGAVKWTDFEI